MPKKLEWISVEVDTRCNIRCTMCPIGHDKVENQGRITMATLERLLNLAQGWTDKIALAVMGEPLLHPQTPEMIRAVNAKGFLSLLWTNGLLVNERRARQVLEAGLNKIIFSFELIDKDLHQRIRKGADYDKVKTNLDRFIAMRDEISPRTEISVWNIVPEDRDLTIPEDIRTAYEGIEIYLSHAMDWNGTISVETSSGEELGDPAPCNQIQNYMSVAWTGDVISCCNDYNHNYILGNINEVESMEEIWEGRRRLDLIARMERGDLQGVRPCNTCSAPYLTRGVKRLFIKNGETHRDWDASKAAKKAAGK